MKKLELVGVSGIHLSGGGYLSAWAIAQGHYVGTTLRITDHNRLTLLLANFVADLPLRVIGEGEIELIAQCQTFTKTTEGVTTQPAYSWIWMPRIGEVAAIGFPNPSGVELAELNWYGEDFHTLVGRHRLAILKFPSVQPLYFAPPPGYAEASAPTG